MTVGTQAAMQAKLTSSWETMTPVEAPTMVNVG